MAAAAPFLSLAMGIFGAVSKGKSAGAQEEGAEMSKATHERNARLVEAEG